MHARHAPFLRAVASAALVGALATLTLALSWRWFEFDAALTLYAQALVVSAVLTTYRFTVWCHRPPTKRVFVRAAGMLRDGATWRSAPRWLLRCVTYFALNRFIWKRSPKRWAAHWPVMLGCLMALGVVVPLIAGWVWFETAADRFDTYRIMVFGHHVRTIALHGLEAFLIFHGLVWAAVPVVVGTSLAMWRRARDAGEQAVQTWEDDWLPLIWLLAIALTGLLMAMSYSWWEGWMHPTWTTVHAALVVGVLLWLPYSKLLHVPQRSLKLAHMVTTLTVSESVPCGHCGVPFASREQLDDLMQIEAELGFRYELGVASVAEHYQAICPRCRRAALARAQASRWRHAGRGRERVLAVQEIH